ncbi:hypothetical protein IEQ34_014630 [Dendrobium chrysotoxum]|uniref:BZIP transcription factor n=1 Tax=Dendrobium chrysotoxum TaxID=161865 RepID=A0AAV7GMJ8_DENCH|nr:hypothetical protein IEQ34_014630 [Dendrobium chrysotoxum]
MGCGGSKLEELNAVALCRERSDLLAEAIRHRYALADAHAAYADSLRSVGAALHRFLDGGLGAHVQGSPILSLPAQRKGDPLPPPSPAPPPPAAAAAEGIPSAHSRSRSQSGSHIHFHSSDDSDSDGDFLQHSDSDSPVHLHIDHHELLSGPTYFNVHYARSNPPPTSVSFEQRVENPELVHYGSVTEPSSSSSYTDPFGHVYQPTYYGYPGMGGFFGSQSPPAAMSQAPPNGPEANSKASTSRAALLPPSPPRTSTWDFLNPFESFESYYPPYTPSWSSKEVREDEGIPDLEEDEQEVIKEAYVDQNFVASNSVAAMQEYSSKGASVSGENVGSSVEGSRYDLRPKEDEVEKNVVGGAVQKPHEGRSVAAPRRYHDVSEVASEIRVQFERAAESTKDLARVLEVGKLPYIRKKSVFSASSRMMCVIPALSAKDEDLVYDEDKVMSTGNLSSTLQKLYIWEQKLHAEVRVEEKLRLLHERNSKKLKRLDVRGAEAHKIEATQTFVRKLSTKIRIAIQIVNSITTKIDVLRDEELWPQIDGLIQGFERMWGVMLECHQIQNRAIAEASHLDSIASRGKVSDELMNAIMHLEMELMRWIGNFSAWINSQKNFVKALNSWLVLCLHYEPEVTADGIPPYSPGRIGAPPVFVIFNCWSQALDRISDKEIVFAMQSSAASIKQLWQQNDMELHQKMISNRDMERLFKMREREVQVINKELDALNVSLNQSAEPSSLQSALRQLFQSMENFATDTMKAYEDLHARAVESKAVTEEAKTSQM